MRAAAIYARVSSDRQKEEHTIASQTAALMAFAREQDCDVPVEWVFEDEGYSGASLVRPGLERVRDLAAEGRIEAVLVHAPDRLSRRYAHQILLIEEFARVGVETLFVRSPRATTPEDQLLLQFQGMIAEYERAQILERSRRGKRHRAQQGQVNVLSGAPFGYRYVRKTDQSAAYYEVVENQARIVRMVYELYTVQGLSIGAITRHLNEQRILTCKGLGRWERSTLWAMLRNPAYKGVACFGKTAIALRQRVTRPIRLRGGVAPRNSASHERPRADWIAIPVPALISENTFALAAERLEANKNHSPRRTVTPSLVQGLVSCAKCGYALYRTSTRSSARTIHYYRCLGSDKYRRFAGPVCDNRPVRQDLLDKVVWIEVVRLLEDPQLIQIELDRRLQAARRADPAKRREEALRRDLLRIHKSIERLLTAYQEDLISLDELRQRMPDLRMREQTSEAELQAIADQSAERAACLRLAETVADFLSRLRSSAGTLNVPERQRVVRLLVKEIFVGDDKIVIRHSIPLPANPPGGPYPNGDSPGPGQDQSGSYLLRSGRNDRALRRPLHRLDLSALFKHPCRQPFADQPDDPPVADPMLNKPYQPCMADRVEERPNIRVEDPIDPPLPQPVRERVQRIVLSTLRPEPVTEPQEFRLVDRRQDRRHGRLDNLVLQRGNAQRSTPPIRLRNIPSTVGQRSIPSPMHTCVKALEVCLQTLLVLCPRQPVDPRRGVLLQSEESRPQNIDADMMQECGQRLCFVPGYGFSYASLRM
jgi:site-specific DNA recombinase